MTCLTSFANAGKPTSYCSEMMEYEKATHLCCLFDLFLVLPHLQRLRAASQRWRSSWSWWISIAPWSGKTRGPGNNSPILHQTTQDLVNLVPRVFSLLENEKNLGIRLRSGVTVILWSQVKAFLAFNSWRKLVYKPLCALSQCNMVIHLLLYYTAQKRLIKYAKWNNKLKKEKRKKGGGNE